MYLSFPLDSLLLEQGLIMVVMGVVVMGVVIQCLWKEGRKGARKAGFLCL